ncbi:MAG: hypothetical protein Fues2KO_04240 [Fuerstiella sp.]
MKYCCDKLRSIVEDEKGSICATNHGYFLLTCADSEHAIRYCPFCGHLISAEDKAIALSELGLEIISGLPGKNICDLIDRLGQPDEQISVEDNTAMQYRFDDVVDGQDLFAIERKSGELEFLIVPGSCSQDGTSE